MLQTHPFQHCRNHRHSCHWNRDGAWHVGTDELEHYFMAGNFDPYWEWLKIPLNEQPPNHYRLLRLTPFESNPQVIETAVNQLVERMQKLSQGNQVAHAQKILNDVAKANICLRDPKKKQEYDTQLKAPRSRSPNGIQNSKSVPVQSRQNSETKDVRAATSMQADKSTKKPGNGLTFEEQKKVKLMKVLAPLMALAGAVSGILLVWFLPSGNSESVATREKSSSTQNSQPVDEKGSSTQNSQPVAESSPTQPEKKSAFSEVAISVAKKMELETDVAEKDDKKDVEKGSNPEQNTQPAPSNVNSAESTPLNLPPESTPTVNTPSTTPPTTPAPTVPDNATPDAPAGTSEGPKRVGSNGDAYAPDKQTLFESLIKKEIFLEGTVLDVESSKSGKTHYLTFGRRQEVIFIMAGAADVALEKLSPLKGQHVRVRGIVEKEYERTGLRIKNFEQIQIQNK